MIEISAREADHLSRRDRNKKKRQSQSASAIVAGSSLELVLSNGNTIF